MAGKVTPSFADTILSTESILLFLLYISLTLPQTFHFTRQYITGTAQIVFHAILFILILRSTQAVVYQATGKQIPEGSDAFLE
jgi:hypothetical protein